LWAADAVLKSKSAAACLWEKTLLCKTSGLPADTRRFRVHHFAYAASTSLLLPKEPGKSMQRDRAPRASFFEAPDSTTDRRTKGAMPLAQRTAFTRFMAKAFLVGHIKEEAASPMCIMATGVMYFHGMLWPLAPAFAAHKWASDASAVLLVSGQPARFRWDHAMRCQSGYSDCASSGLVLPSIGSQTLNMVVSIFRAICFFRWILGRRCALGA
jgi:hypothetical protein